MGHQGFRKKRAKTSLPLPRTNFTLNGCYAAQLQDCSRSFDREHFVSKSLLKEIERKGGLRVTGFPWQAKDTTDWIPPQAIAASVLCKRHNQALSPLDAIAARLFRAMDESVLVPSPQLYLFCGHEIERWLLKLLCGAGFSGNFTAPTKSQPIPIEWLRILFGRDDFPDQTGLYTPTRTNDFAPLATGIGYGPILHKAFGVVGLQVLLCSYQLSLLMQPVPDRTIAGVPVAWRPMELHTTGPNYEKSLMFSWDGPADLGSLEIAIGVPPAPNAG